MNAPEGREQSIENRWLDPVRRVARRAALSVLTTTYDLANRLDEDLGRPRVQFFFLHEVRKGHKDALRLILGRLAAQHEFVTYSEAVERVRQGAIDRPYVAFSFDDGLQSSRIAFEVLEEFGIQACMFLCPPMVGETDPERVAYYCRARLNIEPEPFLDWAEIESMVERGHEVGAHTMTHPLMASLSLAELEDEIGTSGRILRHRFGAVPHFAWPFGHFRHFHPAGPEVVFRTGFESCASGVRGCHVAAEPRREALCIRRDLVALDEPPSQHLYFWARNARTASASNNQWPQEWLSA